MLLTPFPVPYYTTNNYPKWLKHVMDLFLKD